MKQFITTFIAISLSIIAFGQHTYPGRYVDIVDMKTYVDDDFNIHYSFGIHNKTGKTITSVKVLMAYRDPYKEFNVMEVENWEIKRQVTIPGGEIKYTPFIDVMPNHARWKMYGLYLEAVRFSDGTMIQRGSQQEFGDYWP